MSDRKAKSVQRLSRAVWKLYRRLSKGLVTWLLRSALLINRQRRTATGFVLPTTVFLILVVALTAGALSYRAFNSSTRTIGSIQSRAIYNAATPAIDRARSKIETLFKDPRYPGGVPSEGFLTSMMLNDGRTIKGNQAAKQPGITINGDKLTDPDDPFTLSDEKRVDVNGDNLVDNAWAYHDNETKSSVVYSITFSIPPDDNVAPGWQKLLQMNDAQKAVGTGEPAAGPFVRTGPLSNSEAVTCRVSSGSTVEAGWYQDATDTSKLRKRFQIDAFVVKDDAANPGKPPNITTLELAQDRLLERGNKWGAWFRNDLEIFPGKDFNWNGAMHTEGSLIVGPNSSSQNFKAFLISSPNSCLFLPETNSEISVRQVGDSFYGLVAAGDMRSNNYGGNASIHIYQGKNYDASNNLTETTDLVEGTDKKPYSISLDPATIVTQDGYKAREGTASNSDAKRPQGDIDSNEFVTGKRFAIDKTGDRPYIDDTYRADNRYGPKRTYGKGIDVEAGKIGQPISGADVDKLTNNVPKGDPSTVGLDGYWERRSIVEGLRILVGQRLELGNPAGWVSPQNRSDTTQSSDQAPNTPSNNNFTDLRKPNGAALIAASGTDADLDVSDNEGDPLYPPHRFANPNRAHEERERRALRDNLAAVQATAVYHYKADGAGSFPTACLVTTAHPGTPFSLKQSVNFMPNQYLSTVGNPEPWIDFFYGKGTNGWEFSPPAASETDFANAIAAGQPLGNALRNLANFAGDPDGAFPPQQGTTIRPDPTLTMWGNFSNLRRTLETPGAYASLSPADKTYLHTAACTLGMLSYNLEKVQSFDPFASYLASAMSTLGGNLYSMMDGNSDAGQIPDVLPKEQLSTYKDASGNYTGTYNSAFYNPRDYDRVTPAMFLATLKNWLGAPNAQGGQGIAEPENDARYQLALLIHEHYQLRRDRTYGFRPSPAANTWNYNPYLINSTFPNITERKPTLWSSACDPNLFPVTGAPQSGSAGASGLSFSLAVTRQRLALSRLCGAVIPPGAMHDFPGDNNYPSRGSSGDLEDISAATSELDADTGVTDEFKKLSPTISSTQNTAFTQTTLNTAPYNDSSFKRALVAPEFPSLYYIFPEFNHDQDGDVQTVGAKTIDHRQPGNTTDTGPGGTPTLNNLPAAFQTWTEPYITTAKSINSTATYQVVNSGEVATDGLTEDYPAAISYTQFLPTGINSFNYKPFQVFLEKDKLVSLGANVVRPRATDLSDWKLPKAATPAANSPNRIRTPNDTISAVAFQDKVLFNGRELQPSRILDIDLDMLRNASPTNSESWLPASGVVYAFREDALREDAIIRPDAGKTQTDATVPGSESDPKLSSGEISTKPVDFVPDPDRRVHGFRLRNGDKLKRIAGSIPDNKNNRGLSFFSDNLAYIMGDFNKHQTAGGDPLEEFTQQIGGTLYSVNNFYGRSNREPNFAKAATDEWRPSEVLADTITILSNNFCDGSIIDTFMTAGLTTTSHGGAVPNNGNTLGQDVYGGNGAGAYNNATKGLFAPGCSNGQATSFLNQNRPSSTPQTNWDWMHEIRNDPFSPIKISRNGNGLVTAPVSGSKPIVPVEYSGTYNSGATTIPGDYLSISGTNAKTGETKRPLQNAASTTVNTIFISGIVPSRLQQSYGGLHNFPRFLEWWNDGNTNLNFAGSFLQLNFSNYATGPYDQDVWEPNASTQGDEAADYYGPPNRRWGYDVALQMVPVGPAAARFVTPGTSRNEFYTEPATNDVYMQQLCRALKAKSATAPNGVDMSQLNCPT